MSKSNDQDKDKDKEEKIDNSPILEDIITNHSNLIVKEPTDGISYENMFDGIVAVHYLDELTRIDFIKAPMTVAPDNKPLANLLVKKNWKVPGKVILSVLKFGNVPTEYLQAIFNMMLDVQENGIERVEKEILAMKKANKN